MKLQPATVIAAEIIEALYPHCVEIQVAGSVRREMPIVKDVEIVLISKTTSQQMDLFGSTFQVYYHTDQAITKLIDREILAKDTTVERQSP
jgi:DNA polymerase/3'-5' exonuclease PolX